MTKSYLKFIFLMYIISLCIAIQPVIGSFPKQQDSMQLNANWWDNNWT